MKNIIENNKLIAEFMGVFDKILSTGNIHSWSDAPFYYTTEDTREKVIKNISKYSKYSKDWNWLMQVVEKIETTSYDITQTKPYLNNKDRFKGTTSLCGEFIIGYDDREDFKGWTSYVGLGTLPSIIIKDFGNRFNTKIEAVYNACVEFIKWYNEQNKV